MAKTRPTPTNQFKEASSMILLVMVNSVNDSGSRAQVNVLESFKGDLPSGRYQLDLDSKAWKYSELKINPSELLVIFASKVEEKTIHLSHPRGIARFVENFLAASD